MTLQYAKRNQIAHFIIDSGKNNVLVPEFHKEFFHRLKEFELDPTIKVGLFYGAEGRCFSVGDDLKSTHKPQRTRLQELEAYLFLHQGEEKPQRPGWEHDVLALRRNKPIVSAVEGYCLGAAFLFCLAHSDVRVATHRRQSSGSPASHSAQAEPAASPGSRAICRLRRRRGWRYRRSSWMPARHTDLIW